MNDTAHAGDAALSPEQAHGRARAAGYSEAAAARAAALALTSPAPEAWRRFVRLIAGALGVGLLASGVVTFFAFNWARLGPMAKIGLIQALSLAAFAAAVVLRRGLPVRLALALVAVLVGVLLAVLGQTYQLGRDPYQLFLAWAALILPLTIGVRFSPVWLLWTVVLDVGLMLMTAAHTTRVLPVFLVPALVGALAMLGWELIHARRGGPFWLLRTWAVTALLPLTVAVALAAADRDQPGRPMALIAGALAFGLVAWAYHRRRADPFIQTLACLLPMAALTCTAGRHLLTANEWAGGLLMLALLIVGQVSVVVAWLRRQARRGAGL